MARPAGDAVRNGDIVIHPKSLEPRWFAWGRTHARLVHIQNSSGGVTRIPDLARRMARRCVGPDETPPDGWIQDPDVLDTWFSLSPVAVLHDGVAGPNPELEKFYPTVFSSPATTSCSSGWREWYISGRSSPATTRSPSAASVAPGAIQNVFLHGLIRDEHGRR